MPDGLSVTLNSRAISFIIGIITLMSLLTGFVTIFNNYTFRVETLETKVIELSSRVKSHSIKTDKLSEKLFELTLEQAKFKEREQTREQTREQNRNGGN